MSETIAKRILLKRERIALGRKDTFLIPGSDNVLCLYRGYYTIENPKGEVVSKSYRKLSLFDDGLAVFTMVEKKGVVNSQGKEILARLYDNAAIDGKIVRICQKNLWGFADRNGKVICEPKYQFIEKFTKGIARFTPDGRLWGIINTKGEVLVKPKYTYLGVLDNPKKIVAQNYVGYGVISSDGDIVLPFGYAKMYPAKAKGRYILFNSPTDKVLV